MMQINLREKYPVHITLDVLDGFDIYRSTKLIIAIVVIDSEFGKKIKLYRWQKRYDKNPKSPTYGNNVWKVDLCRMSVLDWNFTEIENKILEFEQKYNVSERYHEDEKRDEEEYDQYGLYKNADE